MSADEALSVVAAELSKTAALRALIHERGKLLADIFNHDDVQLPPDLFMRVSDQLMRRAPDAAQAGGDGLAVTDAMVMAAWRAFLMEATPAPLSPFNNENKPAMRSALVAALKVAADAAQEAKP